jgi:ABC-2 type transport system ATP-binding protein
MTTIASTTNRPALKITGLRKSYGDSVVLDGIDLEVAEGTVFALLGPNGAGKTTTVQILSTLIRPDAGEVSVGGFDLRREPERVRDVIGVTGQFSAVDNLLTGEENLLLMADLHHLDRRAGRRRAAELLERFDLADAAKRTVATYSGGMKRKLDLAMTLVAEPRLIFLDEPTTGLDPRSRRTMRQIIRELVQSGVTIFLTTQYLEEVDELADRVAVLDRGGVVAEGAPAAAPLFRESSRDDEALVLQVPTDDTPRSLRALLDRVDQLAVEVDRVTVETPNLDDVFLALTGDRELKEAA